MGTNDGGLNWEDIECPADGTLYSVCFVNNNMGWIAGGSGKILHTDNGGGVGLNEISTESSQNTLNIFPNPTSNQTTIFFKLHEQDEITLSLFSLSGQEIRQMFSGKKSQGTHRFEIDCSNLSNGIYLVKLQSGNEIITQKLLVR